MFREPRQAKLGGMRVTRPTDEELMREACAGDREAFGTLVDRLWLNAVRYCLTRCRDRDLAQDLAQEGFLRLYTYRGRYQPKAGVWALLSRILNNLLVDHSRRTRTQANTLAEVADRLPFLDERASPAHVLESREEIAILYRALQALSPVHRQLVVYRELQGLTYKEMAEVTGISFDSVRVELHRARRRLEQELRGYAHAAKEAGERGVR